MCANLEPGAVWQPYGLAGDPFFTAPLQMLEGATHGIHLFQGDDRRDKADRIAQRVLNSDNSLSLIEGPNGIGKTSLANLVKHTLAGTSGTAVYADIVNIDLDHPRPVEALAANILHAAMNALRGTDPDAAREAEEAGEGLVLDELVTMRGKAFSFSKLFGYQTSRPQILREARERAFADWYDALSSIAASARASDIDRIVIHINNLDQAVLKDSKRTGDLFGSGRDIFQIQGFHFLLCASEGFRLRSLKDRQNVLDILGTPTRPEPLSREDAVQVMTVRLEDLHVEGETLTPPMKPDAFADLYEVFDGELRGALEAVGQVFKEELGASGIARQLDAHDILKIQRPIVQDLLADLTETQLMVLKAVKDLAGKDGIRQSDLVKHFGDRGIAQGTISGATDVLANNQWIRIQRPNARATFYRLGGRARIIEDLI